MGEAPVVDGLTWPFNGRRVKPARARVLGYRSDRYRALLASLKIVTPRACRLGRVGSSGGGGQVRDKPRTAAA